MDDEDPGERERLVASPSSGEELELRRAFSVMALWFAVSHGFATIPVIYATATLHMGTGYWGNGLLFSTSVLSSLFAGVPTLEAFGPPKALRFGASLYAVFAGGFALAALCAELGHVQAEQVLYLSSCVCGGLAAGVLWTAQGAFFVRSVNALARASGRSSQELTATLASQFAGLLLFLEFLARLGFGGLLQLHAQVWHVAALFCALCCVAAWGIGRAPEPPDAGTPCSTCSSWAGTVELWSDWRVWVLSPLNMTFGFSAAFMNGYVNEKFAGEAIGIASVGYLASVTVLVSMFAALAIGPLSAAVGKGVVTMLGSMCFVGIACSVLALGCCQGWGWRVLLLYVLQGCGRAVYESNTRAVFADIFPDKSAGAFANCMFQSSMSFAACFVFSYNTTGINLARVVLVLALATTPCYYAASRAKEASGVLHARSL